MLFVLVFFFHFQSTILAFTNEADVDCGVSALLRTGKIVNGQETIEGEFPWVVSLVGLRGEHICGGVLINPKWVLTAAHCIMRDVSQFHVSVSWSRVETDQAKLYRVHRVVNHPSYDPSRSKVAHDVSLIQLTEEMVWNHLIQPICLPNRTTDSFAGQMATVAGWGRTQSGGRHATKLRKVDVPVLTNDQCQQWLKEDKKAMVLTENSMCAGYEEGGKDSCNGDSGGPLMVKTSGRYTVVGVVSGGIGCALPRRPGVYTRINNYLKWISVTIN